SWSGCEQEPLRPHSAAGSRTTAVACHSTECEQPGCRCSVHAGSVRARRGVGAMRFLFVVPPLTGHVNPTISVARALQARGHEVAWVGHPGKVRPLLPAGARLFVLPEQVDPDHARAVVTTAQTARGAAALKFLWEDFLIPLARSMRPGIEA